MESKIKVMKWMERNWSDSIVSKTRLKAAFSCKKKTKFSLNISNILRKKTKQGSHTYYKNCKNYLCNLFSVAKFIWLIKNAENTSFIPLHKEKGSKKEYEKKYRGINGLEKCLMKFSWKNM